MKRLSEILSYSDAPKEIKEVLGFQSNIHIENIAFDSRKVTENTLFVAVRGTHLDGHHYLQQALDKGAAAIICEKMPTTICEGVCYVVVQDSSVTLSKVAANFYDNPSDSLKIVGVTGTNGKTTTTTLLYDLFTALGYQCGLISTVEYRVAGRILPSTHTTPDPISLQWHFAEMVKAGCDFAFMEVSSHAIHQNRVAGVQFAGAIFSNITHDHLDYHGSFANYIAAKKKLFDDLGKHAFALTNKDDKNGMVMMQNTKAKVHTYSLKRPADFKAKIVENTIVGLHLDLAGHEFHVRLIGEFNAYNLLACYASAVLLGVKETDILIALSNLRPAEGRFDLLRNEERDLSAIVDYAHTPDALEKVLQTIDALRRDNQRIITITGCGGDRDPAKRKFMGKIAAMYSDLAILTSDNPRSEDPLSIIAQMREGISPEFLPKVLENADRRQAIKTAIQLAKKGDIILLAGKGHEKYQEINGVKHPFDDKAVLLEML
jgi:UDP-N-acetylmuramoyl-L-alanyl-D-glutamate--2,6-diaminopimelate ligase